MKHNKIFTINLDEETSEKLKALAKLEQRKVAELLRILLNPVIDNEWIKKQKELFPENNQPPQIAHFKL